MILNVILIKNLTKQTGNQTHRTHAGKKIISTLHSPMIMTIRMLTFLKYY